MGDLVNMYNEIDEEMAQSFQETEPDLLPVVAFFYEEPAVIRLNRVDGQLTVE